MGKIVITLGFLSLFLYASEVDLEFKKVCLECHKQQQIPSGLIYKRYLLKYSNNKYIKKAMLSYIKNPKKENSIMPKPFFLKFPMKDKIILDDSTLHRYIQLYIEMFDIRKKLILEK